MIESTITQNINFIIYEMPPFIFGEANYNLLECVEYVIHKLKKDKNLNKILDEVNFYPANLVYIKWDLEKI